MVLAFVIALVFGWAFGSVYALAAGAPLFALQGGISLLFPFSGNILASLQFIAAALGGSLLVVTLLVHLLITLIAFAIAQALCWGPTAMAGTGLVMPPQSERWMRGILAGLNAGANAALVVGLIAIGPTGALLGPFGPLVSVPTIPALSVFLTFGSFLAVVIIVMGLLSITAVARGDVYQILYAWLNWVLPMSWPTNVVGLLIWLVNTAGRLLVPSTSTFNWLRGDVETIGGVAIPFLGGYNTGNFNHVNSVHTDQPDSPGGQTRSGALRHEWGHTLSGSAYGWIVWLIGAIVENPWLGPRTYTELIAEGTRRDAEGFAWVNQWGIAANIAPTAVIGGAPNGIIPISGTIPLGVAVTLDATGSFDPDGFPGLGLTFMWTDEATIPPTPIGDSATVTVTATAGNNTDNHHFALVVSDRINISSLTRVTVLWSV